MNQDLVTKDFEILEKSVDDAERSIKQYISTTTLDRGKDIMLPKGLDETNYRKNPVVLFNHNKDLVIGRNLWLKKESDGVLAKTQFANTPFADDIYILNKEGCLNAWSIGFMPRKWDFDQEKGITTYTDWELFEYSSVSVPMNQDAVNTAKAMVKSDMAKNLFEKQEMTVEIKNLLLSFPKDIERLDSLIKELDAKIEDKDWYESMETVERKIFELNEEIKELKKKLETKTLGSLGEHKSEIEKAISGELRSRFITKQ